MNERMVCCREGNCRHYHQPFTKHENTQQAEMGILQNSPTLLLKTVYTRSLQRRMGKINTRCCFIGDSADGSIREGGRIYSPWGRRLNITRGILEGMKVSLSAAGIISFFLSFQLTSSANYSNPPPHTSTPTHPLSSHL